MAVAKASHLKSIQRGTLDVQQQALVIGGGVAGMTAALSIASQGFPVYLLEKQAQLGGHLRHIHTGFDGSNPQALLSEMIEQVNGERRITVMLESEPVEISGYVGQYRTIVSNAAGTGPSWCTAWSS
jgi:heterodisulfide reductase subunit A2